MIYQICDVMRLRLTKYMRVGVFLNISFEPQPDMSVNRIKIGRNNCKVNTEGSAPGKCFVFSYKITFR